MLAEAPAALHIFACKHAARTNLRIKPEDERAPKTTHTCNEKIADSTICAGSLMGRRL
jgi:hypothetical protein